MTLSTDAALLEQLRAIGWTDEQIQQSYPQLLPGYGEQYIPPASTLFERLITVGWTEERIREEHPEILPESEGGIMETIGEPIPQDSVPSQSWRETGTQPYDLIFDPQGNLQPGLVSGVAPPVIGGNQTADLFTLALLFL